MTSNQVFENCQLEKSRWKINPILTTKYIILPWNQHSIFIFHYFNAKLIRNTLKLQFDSYVTAVKFLT